MDSSSTEVNGSSGAMKVVIRGTFLEVTEDLGEVNSMSKRWVRSKSVPLRSLDSEDCLEKGKSRYMVCT